MNKELRAIRGNLQDMAKAEAINVWRLARRMEAHGCDPENIRKAREEGSELYDTMGCGYPERLLDPFRTWNYAFKF